MSMKVAFLLNIISPHQLPLAKAIASYIGYSNFIYVYLEEFHLERAILGWECESKEIITRKIDEVPDEWLKNADVLYTGVRCLNLIEARLSARKKVFYYSERWFKPPIGIFRLISPSFLRMALKFVSLITNYDYMYYLPVGIHAARDMARLCGLLHGDIRCLFRAPKLDFDQMPGGKIWIKRLSTVAKDMEDERRYCLDKMRIWGYFVEPSKFDEFPVADVDGSKPREIKVLWVGRLLHLKRVDTIIRAVGELSRSQSHILRSQISLDIYGTGPEEDRLKKFAANYGDCIKFYPPVPIAEVRQLMREHNVYVLSSNGYEGWGAVVSEALEEGMTVIGTYEAGSSATILPEGNLFHAGDCRRLKELLRGNVSQMGIYGWGTKTASENLIQNF